MSKLPPRWNKTMVKILPKDGGLVLDVGAGNGSSQIVLEKYGYKWISLDIEMNKQLSLNADAHFLPFYDKTFDLVISIAVLEHLRNPWNAVKEINRVIKNKGFFFGSVAFLEQFHKSYFHFTHLGLQEILSKSGFELLDIFEGWHVVTSIGRSLFRFPFEYPLELIGKSIMFTRKILLILISSILKISKEFKEEEKYRFSGSLIFLAQKC